MNQPMMHAIRVHEYGDLDRLIFADIPRPAPQGGEVVVQVKAAGVLPAEWKMRQGFFQGVMPITFPYIPGSAFAGVVAAVGAGVTQFREGQAVFGRTPFGTYAEYVRAPCETIALKPPSLAFTDAATISGGATVAWTALFENGALQAGQQVLIHGAAGGVGLFAVQFARWKGAHVFATASTANVAFVASLGADAVIDYTTTQFERVVPAVDIVLDTLGGTVQQRSFAVIKPGGILISLLEEPSQAQADAYRIRAMKNSATLPFPSSTLLHTIAQMLVKGAITTVIATTFPLQAARQAQQLSQSGHGRGRIVLQIAE